MIFKEFCGVGVFPFREEVALSGADDVHGVDDAGHGVLADAENGELDGGDALVDAAVVGGVGGGVPLREDVCGAEDGHQLVAEEVGCEALLYCEELGVDVLVTLPDVVGVAEARHDVERGEHGGGEVVILCGCRPVVSVGEHGERVVTEFFQRGKEAFDTLDVVG